MTDNTKKSNKFSPELGDRVMRLVQEHRGDLAIRQLPLCLLDKWWLQLWIVRGWQVGTGMHFACSWTNSNCIRRVANSQADGAVGCWLKWAAAHAPMGSVSFGRLRRALRQRSATCSASAYPHWTDPANKTSGMRAWRILVRAFVNTAGDSESAPATGAPRAPVGLVRHL